MGTEHFLFCHSTKTAFALGKYRFDFLEDYAFASRRFTRFEPLDQIESLIRAQMAKSAEEHAYWSIVFGQVFDHAAWETSLVAALKAFLSGGTDFEYLSDNAHDDRIEELFSSGFALTGTIHRQGQADYQHALAREAQLVRLCYQEVQR